MKLKRAIWISVLTYIATFMVGLIAAQLTGFDVTSGDSPTTKHWVVSIVLSVIVIYFFTLWYFKKLPKITTKEGFYFGLTLFIVGWVMDAIIIIPTILLSDSGIAILEYYLDPLFWVAVIAIILAATLAGYIKRN